MYPPIEHKWRYSLNSYSKAVASKSSFGKYGGSFKIASMMPRIPSKSLRAILAENVRSFRKQHGYSQEALADSCELHRTYIGSIERGERNVSLSTLEVLARVLGVSVPELLTQGAKCEREKPPRL